MKSLICSLLFICVIGFACDDKKPAEEKSGTEDGKEKVEVNTDKQAADDVKNAKGDFDKIKEALEKMNSLSADEVKLILPRELMGATQSDVDVSDGMGTQVASAEYKVNDSVELKLEIIDVGGAGGAGMFTTQYANMIDASSDDDEEYSKAINFKGAKAIENCKKKSNSCTLTWFDGKRFLLSLRGENTGIEKLKDIAKGIETK